MRSTAHRTIFRAGWITGICLAIAWIGIVYAQDTQPQDQIRLPPAFGGTPLSFQIEAEAKYVAAQGAFMESAAIAEKIHAEAVSLEIKNSVDAVKAFFDRREENKKRRLAERGGTYQDFLDRAEKAEENRIGKYFKETLKGDVTNELNWLLLELSGPKMVVQYMNRDALSEFDAPLSKADLDQMYLTDGGRAGGKLVFALGDGQMLKTPWPYALSGSEFANERKEFEDSRDALLKEIQENSLVSEESGKRIMKAVNQLFVKLDNAYPEEKRKDTATFLQFDSGKRFIQSLILQVTRALSTKDRSVFDGSLRFKGQTTVDLIQYMCQMGLSFDRPQPGGERNYKSLFIKMRNIYLKMELEKKDGGDTPAKN
jgi:hypothetical protein